MSVTKKMLNSERDVNELWETSSLLQRQYLSRVLMYGKGKLIGTSIWKNKDVSLIKTEQNIIMSAIF